MVNRVKATLERSYYDGFRGRFALLANACACFARRAKWNGKAWLGETYDMDNLATAAFELWAWEVRHLQLVEKVPEPWGKDEKDLVDAVMDLGEVVHAKEPSQLHLARLLNEAVNFTKSIKESKSGGTS